MSRNSIGITPTLSLIGATALWAIATVISKKLLATVPPITLLVAQLVPSVILLWILAAVARIDPLRWRVLVPVALLGCLNPGMSYTLSLLGLTRTTASVATLLWAAEPALIVGMSPLTIIEPAVFGIFRPAERGANEHRARVQGWLGLAPLATARDLAAAGVARGARYESPSRTRQ